MLGNTTSRNLDTPQRNLPSLRNSYVRPLFSKTIIGYRTSCNWTWFKLREPNDHLLSLCIKIWLLLWHRGNGVVLSLSRGRQSAAQSSHNVILLLESSLNSELDKSENKAPRWNRLWWSTMLFRFYIKTQDRCPWRLNSLECHWNFKCYILKDRYLLSFKT